MHPSPAFRFTDDAAIRAFARTRAFAHIFAQTADGPTVAHAPVTLTAGGHLRFHLARVNPLARQLDGLQAVASIAGPDGYVSPDWYAAADQVPTWNYVAVEAVGTVRRLDMAGLVDQLDVLGAEHEARLAPKRPWTRGKMTPGRFEAMLPAIIGFELAVERWNGTAKLSRNKSAAERARVRGGFAATGRHDLVAAMVEWA